MDTSEDAVFEESSYALSLTNGSYDWYRAAAIRSRRWHRMSVIAIQFIAAVIPVVAVVNPKSSLMPAILGATVVVLSSFDPLSLTGELLAI